MSSSDFIFPSTIRLLTPEEIRNGPYKDERSREELIEKLINGMIRSGYVLRNKADPTSKYYAEINVSAPDIWKVFTELVEELLPDECAPIWGLYDDDPLYGGNYQPKKNILSGFSPWSERMSNDGELQFGVISQTNEMLEEVFVNSTKFFEVWTSKVDKLRSVLQRHGIEETDHLEFIGQYPRRTSPYRDAKESAEELIGIFSDTFGVARDLSVPQKDQQTLDRELWELFGRYISEELCRFEGCKGRRLSSSIYCRVHHWENVHPRRPCPFKENEE